MTVDAKQAVFRQDGYTFNLFDLPGTYSITEYTPEELYVRRHILDAMPDVVINVLDASNLERNLFLTTQLIDHGLEGRDRAEHVRRARKVGSETGLP